MTRKMEGLESLGSAIWLLGNRSSTSAKDAREQEFSQLLADIRIFEAGPESDNFRLNYAVAMREERRLQALLLQALERGEKGPQVEKLFGEALEYAQLAYKWAGTGQGRTIAAANYLELVNLGLTRMKEVLSPASYLALATKPGKADADTAADLYAEIADQEKDGWQLLRFVDRKSYVDSAHRLWNALRMNSIIVGDYYLRKMDRDDFQSVMENAEPAEKALLRYKDLFEMFTANGHREIVPDSAYFAYAETLKMLSHLKRAIYAFNSNVDLHNQSLSHLLKAISVYPYDDALSEYGELSKRINTNFVTMSPESIVSRVVANDVVARCLDSSGSFCDKGVRQSLEWSALKIKNKLSSRKNVDATEELKSIVKAWKEAMPAQQGATEPQKSAAKGNRGKTRTTGASEKSRGESERLAIIRLSDRYLSLTGEIDLEASAALEQLGRCSAAGVPCDAVSEKAEKLLEKKDELEKLKENLASAGASYTGAGAAAETGAGSLSTIVNELFVDKVDRIISVGTRKKLYDLRNNNADVMHKIIKSAFYAYK